MISEANIRATVIDKCLLMHWTSLTQLIIIKHVSHGMNCNTHQFPILKHVSSTYFISTSKCYLFLDTWELKTTQSDLITINSYCIRHFFTHNFARFPFICTVHFIALSMKLTILTLKGPDLAQNQLQTVATESEI